MKKVNAIISLLIYSLLFLSCSLENDDNETETISMFGIVENPNQLAKYYLLTDDGTRLYTEKIGERTGSSIVNPKDSARVYAEYEMLSPSSANNIKIKSLISPPINEITEESSSRYDKYNLNIRYAGGPDYLNISISHYYTSWSNDYKHQLTLIKKEYKEDEAYFDLVYNNGGDPGKDYIVSPFCFDLSPLKTIYKDSLKIIINAYEKGENNPQSYTLKYKWKN